MLRNKIYDCLWVAGLRQTQQKCTLFTKDYWNNKSPASVAESRKSAPCTRRNRILSTKLAVPSPYPVRFCSNDMTSRPSSGSPTHFWGHHTTSITNVLSNNMGLVTQQITLLRANNFYYEHIKYKTANLLSDYTMQDNSLDIISLFL